MSRAAILNRYVRIDDPHDYDDININYDNIAMI